MVKLKKSFGNGKHIIDDFAIAIQYSIPQCELDSNAIRISML